MKPRALLRYVLVISVISTGGLLRAQDLDTDKNSSTVEEISNESTLGQSGESQPVEPVKEKKILPTKAQARKVFSVLQAVIVPAATFVLFVLILLYFFRRKLLSLLPASSKERKMVGYVLKRFGLDINKILPPPPPK